MSTSKPKVAEDEDVVLHMEELRGNGLAEHPLSAASIAPTESARPHLLETDNVNNPRPRDAGETHSHEHWPDVDDDLLHNDEPISIRPSSPMQRLGELLPSLEGVLSTEVPGPHNINVYQQKKTIAQGMMDLALISANANQFRYVLQSSGRHPYYYPSLAMIGLSLILQVVVGIGLIWNSRYNVEHKDQMTKANRANNWTVIAIFLVTILNVFISSFGVVESAEAMFPSNAGN